MAKPFCNLQSLYMLAQYWKRDRICMSDILRQSGVYIDGGVLIQCLTKDGLSDKDAEYFRIYGKLPDRNWAGNDPNSSTSWYLAQLITLAIWDEPL